MTAGGDFVERRRFLARLLWDAATMGETTLPSGEVLTFAPKEWLEVVKMIYQQIDGPVKPVTPNESDEDETRGAQVVRIPAKATTASEWQEQQRRK